MVLTKKLEVRVDDETFQKWLEIKAYAARHRIRLHRIVSIMIDQFLNSLRLRPPL